MFEGLLSKFKKDSKKKEAPKLKKVDVVTDDGKPNKALLFGSIGLIVLGLAAIAFEYLTTADAPAPQPTALKPPMKPTSPAKPASAPVATPAVAASAPKAIAK